MAGTDEIAHSVAAIAEPELEGFRYFRSYTQVRRRHGEVVDDIIFNVTPTRGGGAPYSLAFYFGVQHREVENVVAETSARKVTPYDRTVFQYSLNIGAERDMKFDGATWWSGIRSPHDLGVIREPILCFVREFVRPYHRRFYDLDNVRSHLSRNDGWVLNHTPYQQVLAIDAIRGDSSNAERYLQDLQALVDRGYKYDRDAFNRFYRSLRERFPSILPQFRLS